MSNLSEAKVADWMVEETLAEHLMPLRDRYNIKWRGHGLIYVDHQQENIAIAYQILVDLSEHLGVPIQLVRSRLIALGWYNDVRTKPVRDDVARVIGTLEPWAADVLEGDDPEMDDKYDQD